MNLMGGLVRWIFLGVLLGTLSKACLIKEPVEVFIELFDAEEVELT